jgi:hypothetical protein
MRVKVMAVILLLFLASAPASAQTTGSMRCNGGLVSVGSTAGEVVKKCGEPTYSTTRQDSRATRDPYTGTRRYSSISVDDWMYNFGPDRFQYRVVMENGIVALIESLDKGY